MTKPKQDQGDGQLFSAENATIGNERIEQMTLAIISSAKKLGERLHQWMASVACHAAMHGDTTVANRGLDAFKDAGFRINGMLAWLTSDKTGAPFVYDKEAKALKYSAEKATKLKAKYEAAPQEVYKALVATHVNKLAKETEFEGFDLDKLLKSVLKRADATLADPTKKDHKETHIHPATLDALRALVNGTPATIQ